MSDRVVKLTCGMLTIAIVYKARFLSGVAMVAAVTLALVIVAVDIGNSHHRAEPLPSLGYMDHRLSYDHSNCCATGCESSRGVFVYGSFPTGT